MRSIILTGVLAGLVWTAGAATATQSERPDVTEVVRRMRAALSTERPSVRRLRYRVSTPAGASEIVVGEARRKFGDTTRILTVVLAPESLRGTADLVEESRQNDDVQWIYVPAVRRVRKVVGPETYSAFLNSDFTYADLRLARRQTRYAFHGEESRDGTRAYRIDGVPHDPSYYSRTVTWVTVDSVVPLEREFYDVAHRLWKIERWAEPTIIDGVPMMRHVSMEDLQAGTRTDIEVTGVDHDVDVPAALFDPEQLPNALNVPVWKGVES